MKFKAPLLGLGPRDYGSSNSEALAFGLENLPSCGSSTFNENHSPTSLPSSLGFSLETCFFTVLFSWVISQLTLLSWMFGSLASGPCLEFLP